VETSPRDGCCGRCGVPQSSGRYGTCGGGHAESSLNFYHGWTRMTRMGKGAKGQGQSAERKAKGRGPGADTNYTNWHEFGGKGAKRRAGDDTGRPEEFTEANEENEEASNEFQPRIPPWGTGGHERTRIDADGGYGKNMWGKNIMSGQRQCRPKSFYHGWTRMDTDGGQGGGGIGDCRLPIADWLKETEFANG
jgi:hypothetical protein